MADANVFAKLVPGFDFLQGLMKNANAALPGMNQWVAPTLNPEEIDKRIEELRTVQFWLEQNARMLGATIQALEVQRMTLSTLRTMNVSMGDLAEAMKVRVPPAAPVAQPEPEPQPDPVDTESAEAEPDDTPAASDAETTPGVVDPMQWWGALTRQFTVLASQAMKETAADAAVAVATKTAAAKAGKATTARKKSAAAPAAKGQRVGAKTSSRRSGS